MAVQTAVDERFAKAEEEYYVLRGQLETGHISRERFADALQGLMLQDSQGHYWSLGAEDGRWYVHDGQAWQIAEPPRGAPLSPVARKRSKWGLFLALAGLLVVVLLVFLLPEALKRPHVGQPGQQVQPTLTLSIGARPTALPPTPGLLPSATLLPTVSPDTTPRSEATTIATVAAVLPRTTRPADVPPATEWLALSGQWSWPGPGLLYGESEDLDGLILYQQDYADLSFSAEVQALDREASLAVRMLDGDNGYLVTLIPRGSKGGNPGVWLVKRVHGGDTFPASSSQNLPSVGEWTTLSVQATGARFIISLNDQVAIDYTDADSAAPAFPFGQLGFRVYGEATAPCHAYFRNIRLP
jgi:hypothetical protein